MVNVIGKTVVAIPAASVITGPPVKINVPKIALLEKHVEAVIRKRAPAVPVVTVIKAHIVMFLLNAMLLKVIVLFTTIACITAILVQM
jgi:hypothetical protein